MSTDSKDTTPKTTTSARLAVSNGPAANAAELKRLTKVAKLTALSDIDSIANWKKPRLSSSKLQNHTTTPQMDTADGEPASAPALTPATPAGDPAPGEDLYQTDEVAMTPPEETEPVFQAGQSNKQMSSLPEPFASPMSPTLSISEETTPKATAPTISELQARLATAERPSTPTTLPQGLATSMHSPQTPVPPKSISRTLTEEDEDDEMSEPPSLAPLQLAMTKPIPRMRSAKASEGAAPPTADNAPLTADNAPPTADTAPPTALVGVGIWNPPAPINIDAIRARNIARVAAATAYIPIAPVIVQNMHPTLEFTPGPFPPIADAHPASALEGVSTKQSTAWFSVYTGSFIVRTLGIEASKPENYVITAGHICEIMRAAVQEGNTLIASPIASELAKATKCLPPIFFIHGVTLESANHMIKHGIWCTSALAFQAMHIEPCIPLHLFSLEGFTTPDIAEITKTLLETWNKPATATFLSDLIEETKNDEFPFQIPQISSYLSSVKVTIVAMKKKDNPQVTPRYNVAATEPTYVEDSHWYKIMNHLKSLAYESDLAGTGHTVGHHICQLCHGVDHPRGLCPFPDLPGWLGEGHITAPPLKTRYRENNNAPGSPSSTWRGGKATRGRP